MRRWSVGVGVLACALLLGPARGQEPPALVTATGLVEKADKDSLTVRPRGGDGKFAKSVVLKATGTSKVTTVSHRRQAGRVVLVQRETDLKDLQKNQTVAIIYATGPSGPVLLAAVAHPAGGK